MAQISLKPSSQMKPQTLKKRQVLWSACGVLKSCTLPTLWKYARWRSAHTVILRNLFLAGKDGGVCEDYDVHGADGL